MVLVGGGCRGRSQGQGPRRNKAKLKCKCSGATNMYLKASSRFEFQIGQGEYIEYRGSLPYVDFGT